MMIRPLSARSRTPEAPRTSSRPVGTLRRGTLILMLVTLLVAGPTAAYGLWSASAQLPSVGASAGSVATPTHVDCETQSFFGLLPRARVHWRAPVGAPAGTSYRLWVDGVSNPINVPAGQTEFVFRTGLLGGVFDALYHLLGIGQQPRVQVEAVHPSGWSSARVGDDRIRGSLGIGIRCA